MTIQTTPIKIFIAYSRLDADYLKELQKYLRPLNRKRTIEIWYDGEIQPGTKWAAEINQRLHAADIILLLITANLLSSDYFYNEEMQKALHRHEKGEAKVIPVILRHCTWRLFDELSELQALPKDGVPLSHWSDDAEAYTNVVEELHRVVISVRTAKTKEEQERFAKLPLPLQKLLKDMVLVEGGNFMMGSDKEKREQPIHKVSVPTFQIGKYPVTQAQWQAVMGKNPSYFKGCDECPVEQVSWNDIKKFIETLNQLTGKKFRLPSEAEWEFAARGGKKSKGFEFSGSKNIEELAWYWKNSGDTILSGDWDWDTIRKNNGRTHPVGEKKANELGLYDMSGNVFEWCEDDWHDTYEKAPEDGSAWINQPRGSHHVVRGGSWYDDPYYCRVADRGYDLGDDEGIGLRLALPQF
ncbi:MAG: SUMF1/EgtB/PvdO family nonheme iron enzyme [Chitinophagales bacterium]